jgi:ribosomal protein S6
MFLVDASDAVADWDKMLQTIRTVFERAGADELSLEKWDERRLCFNVAGRTRGTYILCYIQCDPQAIHGIERDVQLSETLLRVMILSGESIPAEIREKPTPAMLEKERESAEPQEDVVDKDSDDSIAVVEGELDEAASEDTISFKTVAEVPVEAVPTPESDVAEEADTKDV